jgi:hypothetical protein
MTLSTVLELLLRFAKRSMIVPIYSTTPEDLHDEARPGWPQIDSLDIKIMSRIGTEPFHWGHLLAEALKVSHSAILNDRVSENSCR